VKGTCYEAPHYAVFSSILLLPLSFRSKYPPQQHWIPHERAALHQMFNHYTWRARETNSIEQNPSLETDSRSAGR